MNHLVLVAKCPKLGKCKTRLQVSFSPEFCLAFAEAALKDILFKFDGLNLLDLKKWILFRPSADYGDYRAWLEINYPSKDGWELLPFDETELPALQSHDLGTMLTFAIKKVMINQDDNITKVCFIGMDTPHLPKDIILSSFTHDNTDAVICPAEDGGYVMLTVPVMKGSGEIKYFENVEWSTNNTCKSQIQALEASGLNIITGDTFLDVDEPRDLTGFVQMLKDSKIDNCPHLSDVLLNDDNE